MNRFIIFVLVVLFNTNVIYTQNKSNSFIPYWYQLNKAKQAKDNGHTHLYYKKLNEAYKIIIKIDAKRIYSLHYIRLLEYYATHKESKINQFVADNPQVEWYENYLNEYISNSVKDSCTRQVILNSVGSYQKFISLDSVLHPFNRDIMLKLDTLMSLDQCIREGELCDSSLLTKEQWKWGYQEISSYNLIKLIDLFSQYGNFGLGNCTCFYDELLLHIDKYDDFIKVNDYLIDLVQNGYMTPNMYAWIYDRNFNQKYGDFYYHFSFNEPFNTENFIPIEKLTKSQIKEVNIRRKLIGIAKIPYKFNFINL